MQGFKDQGIGGVFIHPRPGMITEYLSDEWFDLYEHTIRIAKENGMYVWIYDENSYPSGFAGGHLPAEMPESYEDGTGLSMEVQEVLNVRFSDTIAVILEKSGDDFVDITSDFEIKKGSRGTFYIFRKTYPGKSSWYGGFSYVDLIRKGVTEKFLDITMREGYERFKSEYGNILLGSFTDEPNLESAMGHGSMMRWTPDLWDVFHARWKYDLRLHLPSLVEEVGNWKKVRQNYYATLSELFIERWVIPYSEYCAKNGLAFTGHYWEHGWPFPTDGFDEAAVYIYHQQPGIDMLGHELILQGQGGQFGNIRAVRELRSAANQAGRLRTLSETYGGGGWDVDFRTYKQLADWQGVLGVNFVNLHLSYYSLNGVRKFDYPPSFSYHEPWWENYHYLADYIARISVVATTGHQINKILVLQPNTTAWMYFSRSVQNPKMGEIQRSFKDFVYRLEREYVEYDLGSEYVLRSLGSVKGNQLVVGERAYQIVVIPETMENVDSSTFLLLQEFLEAGGTVFSFTDGITRIDGSESNGCLNLQEKFPKQWIIATDLSDPKCNLLHSGEDFAITSETNADEVYFQRRVLDDGQLLYIVNSGVQVAADLGIVIKGASAIQMNPEDGSIAPVFYKHENGKVYLDLHLPPYGSAIYFIPSKSSKIKAIQSKKSNWKLVNPIGNPEIKPLSNNVLVIDYVDLKTDKNSIKNTYFMNALISLFKENGIEFGNPWQHKIQYKQQYVEMDTFPENSDFEVRYHFYISEDAELSMLSNLKAVVERPHLWSVSINGNPVEKESDQYWIDKDFPVYIISQYLRKGENTITLKAEEMSVFAEIMPVYIIGDFKIQKKFQSNDFEITNGKLEWLGSWKDQGYFFYSGKVAYTQKISVENEGYEYKIRLNSWKGTVVEILVNDEKKGIIAWPPYELDISGSLSEGDNTITVQIIGSLKNTFGPFYIERPKWIYGPHDWNFGPEPLSGYDQYRVNDYGLFEPFEIFTR